MEEFQKLAIKTFVFLFCAILLQLSFYSANPVDESSYKPCQTRECLQHASMMIKNMNPEVDPCEDFYSFACGGYMRKFGDGETRSIYDDTWFSLQLQIKDLLQNLQPEKGSVSDKLKTVFDNCMNVASSELKAVSDATDFLEEMGISNWPDLKGFQFQDLSETLGKLAIFGEFAFIKFKPSPFDKEFAYAKAHSPALILPGDFLFNSKMKPKDIHSSVERVLDYFSVNKKEKHKLWEQFKEIEYTAIRLLNEQSEDSFDCKNGPNTVHAVINCSEEQRGSMNFLCNIWKSAMRNGNLNRHYCPYILHISCRWNHFKYMENIFSYICKTNPRSLANYLSLRFFISHLDDLNLYFHLTKKTYPADKEYASKTPEPMNRWEYCVSWIIKSMNQALGYEYTQKILTESIQNDVMNIIKDYVQQLSYSIEKIDWLDGRIKSYLLKQLKKLDIGFKRTIDNYKNETAIRHHYNWFHPEKGSYLKNILEYEKASLLLKNEFLFNSFYSSSDPYTMDFGLALLQPPTYAYGLPKIWNYATLGSVIGHELCHNFKFLFDFVHLDEDTENYLKTKMQCYVQRYSHFVMKRTGKMISSSEAEEEIVVDNLGWALSEKVIKNIINSSEQLTLPGLEYSPMQLVYISFAQDSCAVLSKDVEAEFYASKPHNLQKLRVFGILQNSRMFSDTFKCSKGSFMNPEKKCTFF